MTEHMCFTQTTCLPSPKNLIRQQIILLPLCETVSSWIPEFRNDLEYHTDFRRGVHQVLYGRCVLSVLSSATLWSRTISPVSDLPSALVASGRASNAAEKVTTDSQNGLSDVCSRSSLAPIIYHNVPLCSGLLTYLQYTREDIGIYSHLVVRVSIYTHTRTQKKTPWGHNSSNLFHIYLW